MKIRFGTSGWRGVIAREFTWERVDRVVDGIALFLQRRDRGSVVVGGDCRFLSPELAESAARRMSSYGFRAVLSSCPCPTPVLSHVCRKENYGGIINFTASHNPPVYNGIKFSPWHCGPADGGMTSEIEEIILKGQLPEKGEGAVERRDFRPAYMQDVYRYLDTDVFRESDLKLVYDAFSGTGAGILDRILVDLGASVRTVNGERDPLFAGRQHPEPGEEGTRDLAEEVLTSGADLGVATDGDADRFGIVDEKGSFVSPHDFLPLLLQYLIERKGAEGRAVRSVTTGSLLDRVARANGLETLVTPVGFKYLGAEMIKGGVLLAGEESGGLSITDHVPEKDGILACLMAAEMVCAGGRGLAEQLEELWDRYGRVHVSRRDVRLTPELSRYLKSEFFDSEPSEIAGMKISGIDRTDGIKMILEGGGWILLRLSGTEPLARVYAQSDTREGIDHLLGGVVQSLREVDGSA